MRQGGNYEVFVGTATETVQDKNFGNNNLSYVIIATNDDLANSFYLHLSLTQAASGVTSAMVADPETNSLIEVKAGEVLTIEGNYRQLAIVCGAGLTAVYRTWVFQMGVQ